jgi:hypothetical protein
MHLSFPFLPSGDGRFYPLTLLGPLANYIFLRCVGGDKQNESSQEERYIKEGEAHKYDQLRKARLQKNSFWPALEQWKNPWVWVVIASVVVGVGLEKTARVTFT